MSNPLRAPRSVIDNAKLVPDAFFKGELRSYNKKYTIDETVDFYSGLGFPMRNSVVNDREYMKIPDMPTLATAQVGGLTSKLRSQSAYRVNRQMFGTLTDATGPLSTQAVRAAMEDKFFVSGSTQMCRGRFRKYYAKNLKSRNLLAPTAAEVALSMRDSGCVLTGLPPPPLYTDRNGEADRGDDEYIRINMNSDLGYPILGKGTDPGALERTLLLSDASRKLLDECCEHLTSPLAKAKAVEAEIYSWQQTRPHMVLVKGKCKADYYTEAKIKDEMMRFYNALPKHLVFIMQQATQPFEDQTQGLFEHPMIHSAQKIHLVRGGADQLITCLDGQLGADDVAYVHVGDDSWVVYREGDFLVFCALDCSSFDLTQHASITLKVHEAFRDMLMQIDPVSAGVWMAFVRERLVVIEKSVVVKMEHGGPSGTPMQSKINDVLMDIVIKRFLKAKMPGMDEAAVNQLMEKTGDSLGFVIKVEQFQKVRAPTIRAALKQIRFQFIGFYFYTNSRNFVYPFIDLPRCMSQLPYPSGTWTADNGSFKTNEAVRLTSVALGSGIAPEGSHFQEAFYQECSILLLEALATKRANLDRVDSRLRWATQIAPLAMGEQDVVIFASSIRGLAKTFDEGRGAQRIWRHPLDVPKKTYGIGEMLALNPGPRPETEFPDEDPLPSASVFLYKDALVDTVFTGDLSVIYRPHTMKAMEKADFVEAVLTEVEQPKPAQIARKTLGRMPRLKKETAQEQYRRVGRLHKLNAQMRRAAEEDGVEEEKSGGRGNADINERRNRRAARGRASAQGGSRDAQRSAEDAEAKDLRRRGGTGKKGGRRRKK